MIRVPHAIPYQGSKRKIAAKICAYLPKGGVNTLYEPFVGSAATTLYMAKNNLAKNFVIGDRLEPLVDLWRLIVESPEYASNQYEEIWKGQKEGDFDYFNRIREIFNDKKDPIHLLYLSARCVKNAIRFNRYGRMTQSVDKRRLGMHPDKMRSNIFGCSQLLKGRVSFFCGDFSDCIRDACKGDLVYMDPPYQGTTYGRDKRYFCQVSVEEICTVLEWLTRKKVDFLLSYDGKCGDKTYGIDLPDDLGLYRAEINAGRSTQATLNGENSITIESLYMPKYLSEKASKQKDKRIIECEQASLFT